jgi:cytoskeletal protein RodZ
VTRVQELSPNHPRAFGEELKRLRDEAGLSLDEIILETKISRRILESLEGGKFHFLPEQVFCRNFVRQYARLIGTDEQSLMASFDDAWEQFRLASGSHPALLVHEVPKEVIRWHFWVPIIATVGILAAIAVIIVKGPRSEPEIELTPRRQTPEWATPSTRPTEISSAPGDTATETEDSDQKMVRLQLNVSEGKECWIHYRDYEGRTGQQLLASGEELTLELVGPVLLTVGNAGVVGLKVGDQVFQPLGRPGQVLHSEVSRDGMVKLGVGAKR